MNIASLSEPRARLRQPTFWMLFLGAAAGSLLISMHQQKVTARRIDSSSLPLLHSGDLSYTGAFRVPASQDDNDPVRSAFAFGGEGLMYWPAHNSLAMSNLYEYVGEINIPAPVNSANLTDLNRATFLQQPTDILRGHRRDVDGDSYNGAPIGGLFLRGQDLIANVYDVYDSLQSQSKSAFVTGQDFSNLPTVGGPYQIGTTSFGGSTAGVTSKWMLSIPSDFQTALGGTTLAGDCCISIIARTSIGPSVSSFNASDLGTANPVPATVLLAYTADHPSLGPWSGRGTSTYTKATWVAGAVWPQGTRSVLFFGRVGTAGNACYGLGTSDPVNSWPNKDVPDGAGGEYCYDLADNGSHGEHAYPYRYMVWAYDANDLAAVKAGTKQYWQVLPYDTWSFELPIASYSRMIYGVTYDQASHRLFLTQKGADFSASPLVHIFTVGPGTTGSGLCLQ